MPLGNANSETQKIQCGGNRRRYKDASGRNILVVFFLPEVLLATWNETFFNAMNQTLIILRQCTKETLLKS